MEIAISLLTVEIFIIIYFWTGFLLGAVALQYILEAKFKKWQGRMEKEFGPNMTYDEYMGEQK